VSGEPPNRPAYGDPEILPWGTVVRPSTERMPFGGSGALRSVEPALPDGFLSTPDVAHLPWVRRRGDEWTDATFRAAVLAWLVDVLAAATWARRWRVTERATGSRLGSKLDPPVLVVTLYDAAGAAFEGSCGFPVATRTGPSLTDRLARIEESITALHAIS